MILLIKYKKGAELVLHFKSVEFANNYIREQAHNISWYTIIEG